MGFAPPGPFNFKPLFTYVTGGAIRRNKKDGGCRFYHNALRT